MISTTLPVPSFLTSCAASLFGDTIAIQPPLKPWHDRKTQIDETACQVIAQARFVEEDCVH